MGNMENSDNYSIFDIEQSQNVSKKIDVLQLSYIGADHVTWQELFEGYDDLTAITFS